MNSEHCIIQEKHTWESLLNAGKTDSKGDAALPQLIPVV